MHPVPRLTVLMTVFGCVSVVAQPVTSQPVTSQMLLDGLKDPGKWLMFGGGLHLTAAQRSVRGTA